MPRVHSSCRQQQSEPICTYNSCCACNYTLQLARQVFRFNSDLLPLPSPHNPTQTTSISILSRHIAHAWMPKPRITLTVDPQSWTRVNKPTLRNRRFLTISVKPILVLRPPLVTCLEEFECLNYMLASYLMLYIGPMMYIGPVMCAVQCPYTVIQQQQYKT